MHIATDPKDRHLSCKATQGEYRALRRIADAEGRSLSDIQRRALRYYILAHDRRAKQLATKP